MCVCKKKHIEVGVGPPPLWVGPTPMGRIGVSHVHVLFACCYHLTHAYYLYLHLVLLRVSGDWVIIPIVDYVKLFYIWVINMKG